MIRYIYISNYDISQITLEILFLHSRTSAPSPSPNTAMFMWMFSKSHAHCLGSQRSQFSTKKFGFSRTLLIFNWKSLAFVDKVLIFGNHIHGEWKKSRVYTKI